MLKIKGGPIDFHACYTIYCVSTSVLHVLTPAPIYHFPSKIYCFLKRDGSTLLHSTASLLRAVSQDRNSNIHVVYTDPPPSFLWEGNQVQRLILTQGFRGQKVCFPRFTPYYLFMKRAVREGETRNRRETEESPSVRPLMWKTKSPF